MDEDDVFYEVDNMKKIMHNTEQTLFNWRQAGIGPPWIKAGKKILYPKEAFAQWIKANSSGVGEEEEK